MSDEKIYNEACVNEVIQLIRDEEISLVDFNRIENEVKNHSNYEHDLYTAEWEDVLDYVEYYLGSWERETLLNILGVKEVDETNREVGINTLDDRYRFELVMKLFKLSGNELELESFIKPEVLEKVKDVQINLKF